MFSGKTYAIFALLFGLTFFIQFNNKALDAYDFRPRFALRLLFLLLFGLLNSLFFQGDILSIYAVIGLVLIPVAKLNTKVVLTIAILLMLQPYEWYNFYQALKTPNLPVANPNSWAYFGNMYNYIPKSSFLNTAIGNLTNGKTAVLWWTWENGRIFQTASLFMLGMLAGRNSLFIFSNSNFKLWLKTLVIAALSFIILYFVKDYYYNFYTAEIIRRPLMTILASISNVAFMFILVSGFLLLFQNKYINKILAVFAPIGRMSLTNYIMQSIAGSIIYYGFGLGLYLYTGATYSLIIGIFLAIMQALFCKWWIKTHKQGPLEQIWHKLTWWGYQQK